MMAISGVFWQAFFPVSSTRRVFRDRIAVYPGAGITPQMFSREPHCLEMFQKKGTGEERIPETRRE